jgi:hypothetical protein
VFLTGGAVQMIESGVIGRVASAGTASLPPYMHAIRAFDPLYPLVAIYCNVLGRLFTPQFRLDQLDCNALRCVAVHRRHGTEGATRLQRQLQRPRGRCPEGELRTQQPCVPGCWCTLRTP